MAAPGGRTSGERDETNALAREIGARSVAQLEAALARIMAETGANNRWLLGALVLLNGGGIAVLSAHFGFMDAKSVDAASTFFVIGAALAVIAALAGSGAALVLGRQIGEAIALWTQVGASGDIGDGAINAAGKVRRTGLVASLATLAIGLLSLILFVAGAMTLGTRFAAFQTEAATTKAEPPSAPALPAAEPTSRPAPTPVETPVAREAPPPEAAPGPKPEPKAAPRRRARPARLRDTCGDARPGHRAARRHRAELGHRQICANDGDRGLRALPPHLRHPRERADPGPSSVIPVWIPALAGMTDDVDWRI